MSTAAPPSAPPQHATQAPMRNGLGIAALCCGLVGILVGLIPFMFLASGALGILAVVFGLVGIRRVGRREASNRGMAIAGLVTGVIAFAMAIWGISIIMSGLNSLSGDLDHASSGNTVSSATHAATSQEDHLVHEGLWIGNS